MIAHQKGRNTKEKIYRNFGMARPDGCKAMGHETCRTLQRAHRHLHRHAGAYPESTRRSGQAEAIARSIMDMSRLKVPVITVVIGEGGSGGALAIGVANKVLMLENAVYSVISPEGCAAICGVTERRPPRGRALKITALDCVELGVDGVITEPVGGAHRCHEEIFANVAASVRSELVQLKESSQEALRDDRYARFRAMGKMTERATK